MGYEPGSRRTPPLQPKAETWYGNLLKRIVAAAFCCVFAVPLIGLGRNVLKTGVYDFTVEMRDGNDTRTHFNDEDFVKRQTFHETGDWAREQGIGMLAGGVVFAYWGLLILFGPTRSLSTSSQWSWLGTIFVGISFLLCLTALGFIFPPWRVGPAMSSNGFYISLIVLAVVAGLGLGQKNKDLAGKCFGVLCIAAIVLGRFWPGYFAGTLGGIFGGLVLGTHVVLLVPSFRKQALAEGI